MKPKPLVSWDKKSIVFKLTVFVILLLVAQSALLIASMVVAGVLKEARENAFQSFSEKVANRKEYIEREMSNRWTNLAPYLDEISKGLPVSPDLRTPEQFLEEAAPRLISMLRTTMTNGSFIILNNKTDNSGQRMGLYLRDYDPILNDQGYKDLYCIAGPFQIAQKLNIPMDENWSYNLQMTDGNRAFYDMPYTHADLSVNSSLLGYWSRPFQLTPGDIPIITYTMPLFDRNNELRGIIGVELSVDYITRFLPATDLQAKDSLGYLIGYKGAEDTGILPLITNGALQRRILHTDQELRLSREDMKRNIYLLQNHNSREPLYASIQKMGLYYSNTPFEQEEWYLIGFMKDNPLLSFMHKIRDILLISFLGSLISGVIGGYLISFVFTKPIIQLADQVRGAGRGQVNLRKTGLTEIDDLSRAIETANQNLLESTLKLSQIIHLVDVPIGAFEYKEHERAVFATDQLKQVLLIEEEEAQELFGDKEKFIRRLKQLMEQAEPDEEHVFRISKAPDRWVKIKLTSSQSSTLGVVIDVTEDISGKNRIKVERDYDLLTQIYNRRAYERNVGGLLEAGGLQVGALIMLDLDYLKQINDTYGHQWGDSYLTATAGSLALYAEDGHGIIGRLSGDEFAVFLHGFDSQTAIRELISRFYQGLEDNPLSFPGGKRRIAVSAGIFWLEDGAAYSFEEIASKADQALYEAKNSGKGSWKEYQAGTRG